MPPRAIDHQDNEVARELLGDVGQEHVHHGGVGRGEDQRGEAAQLGADGGKDVDELPHDLPGYNGPQGLGNPAAARAIKPSKALRIFSHNHHGTRILRSAGVQEGRHFLREVFLNVACSSALAWE